MQGEGLKKLQSGQPISTREQLLLIAQLSWPAILAQISSVVMQYIDTAMVGQLGSNASAAIGVVATTSWLFGDLCIALTIGFNVAVAQALGARQSEKARGIMKLAFLVCMAFSLVMMAIALGITGNLPRWLRADPAIWQDASAYFLVFVLSLPFMQLNNLCGGLLRSAGNMKTPGICMVVMCLLDVVFNAFLIFPSGTLRVLGGESSIASKVSPLFASENPTAAIYCKTGESEIRVTARAATEAEAETACDARIAEFRKILGPNAYDVDVPGLEYTVVHLLQQKGLHAATAESCTGGLVAEKITNVPGSSEVFGYGFVTYAEAAKAKLLGVDPTLIEQYNVVSGPVAVAMAYGALQASGADLAVGITGIAGPGGALPGKPVGTVYLAGADARSGKAWLMRLELGGYAERSIIRTRAALYALDLLRRMALDIPPENAHPVPSKDVKPETLDI